MATRKLRLHVGEHFFRRVLGRAAMVWGCVYVLGGRGILLRDACFSKFMVAHIRTDTPLRPVGAGSYTGSSTLLAAS